MIIIAIIYILYYFTLKFKNIYLNIQNSKSQNVIKTFIYENVTLKKKCEFFKMRISKIILYHLC